jgi:acetyltransferase-like isoleucine patch superfamily enzyme
MNKALKLLGRINLKTIIFNFRYFPFDIAIKLPVLLSRHVYVHRMKGNVVINAPVRTGMIQIGFGKVAIADFKRSRGIWEVDGDVIFNGRAFIMHGCKINVMKNARLSIGEGFNMSAECAVIVQKQITIGSNSGVSWESLLMDTDFHYIYDEHGELINAPQPITIGDHVWIGCRCTILKGADIPSGSIVAATSLVAKKLSGEQNIFGGNPLRILRSGITWHY